MNPNKKKNNLLTQIPKSLEWDMSNDLTPDKTNGKKTGKPPLTAEQKRQFLLMKKNGNLPKSQASQDDEPVEDGYGYEIIEGRRRNTILEYTSSELGRTAFFGIGGILAIPATIVACLFIIGFGFKLMIDFIIANQAQIQLSFTTIFVGLLQLIAVVGVGICVFLAHKSYNDVVKNGRGEMVARWAIGMTIFFSLNFFVISCSTTTTYRNYIVPTVTGEGVHGMDQTKATIIDAFNQPIKKKEGHE